VSGHSSPMRLSAALHEEALSVLDSRGFSDARVASMSNDYSILTATLDTDRPVFATILVDAVEGLAEAAVAAVFPLGSLGGLPMSDSGPLYRAMVISAAVRDEGSPDLDAIAPEELAMFDLGVFGTQFFYALS